MKKVLLLTLMCAAFVLVGAQNLVINGGFELQEGVASPMVDDPVSNFTFGHKLAWTYSDDSAKEGKFSAFASGVKQARLTQDVVVEQGRTYILSFFYMDLNDATGLKNYSRNGASYPAPYIDQNDGGNPAGVPVSIEEWKKYSITFIALTNIVHLDIRTFSMASIDEVSIVDTGLVPELTANNINEFLRTERYDANTTFNNPITVAFCADYKNIDGNEIYSTYIKDATGWTILSTDSKKIFKAGDIITGLKGTYDVKNGISRMEYVSHSEITVGIAPESDIISLNSLSGRDINRFVKLKNVRIVKEGSGQYIFTFAENNGKKILLYDKFKRGIYLNEGKRYDIEGCVDLNNDHLEFDINNATELMVSTLVVPTIESIEITETSILNPENKTLSLFSISGQRLFHTTGDIDLSTLNHGVYILKCGTEIQKIRL
ncbi:hypothetical protein N9251_01830 [Gammaproteobacteria bacterium]|nr:hypothetical protein [Gammaproteobacteria bacterium]